MSVPDNGGEPTALRVTLSSLMDPNPPNCCMPPPDFSAFEGEYRWVGPPVFATENDNDPTPFIAAPLQCEPYYHDWSTLGLFHLYGDAVVPSSQYDVAVFDQSCAGSEDICVDVSTSLQVITARFGDTAAPFDQPFLQFVDYARVVDKMIRFSGAISKASTQQYGDVMSPLDTINIKDSNFNLNAFFGRAYPPNPPSSCAGDRVPQPEDTEAAESAAAVMAGATLKLHLTPVPPKGTLVYPPGTQIEGQKLSAPTGGFTAFLNVQIQDWNPGNTNPHIRGVQVQIDPESLWGASAFPQDPGVDIALAALSCTSQSNCRDAFGEVGSNCPSVVPRICEPVYSAGFGTGFTPPERIFDNSGLTGFYFATDESPTGPIVFTSREPIDPGDPEPLDDGERKYLGTIALDIPPEVVGHRYVVSVRMGPETFAITGEDTFVDLPIAETSSAVLDIGMESYGLDYNRCRFLSFIPGHSGEQMAIRVKLVSLHHVNPPYTGGPSVPFTSFEGEYRWVGPPTQYEESTSNNVPFYAAALQCTPHYQDWSSAGYLHVTGSAIVPSSEYEVQFVPESCMGNESSCPDISAPILKETTRWGDVEAQFNPPSTTVQPDVTDISALVNKFRSAPGAPIKARAMLAGAPGNPSGEITDLMLSQDLGFSHISACVDAFRGVPYPYSGPEACD